MITRMHSQGRDSAQWQKKLVKYVFESSSPKEQARRLTRIMAVLERTYWANKGTKQISVNWIHRVSKRMFDTGSLGLFFAIVEDHFNRSCTVDLHKKFRDGHLMTGKELIVAGREWFMAESQKFIGGSVNYCIMFGLELCRRWHESMQDIISLGPEETRRRIRQALERPAFFTILLVVMGAAISADSKIIPTRIWLSKLLLASPDNQIAEDVLRSVVHLLTSLTFDDRLDVIEHKSGATATAASAELLASGGPRGYEEALEFLQKPYLHLTSEEYAIYSSICVKVAAKTRRDKSVGEAILARFEESWFETEIEIARKVHEIRTQPKRGLRPNGADHVQINVSALAHAGLHSVSLHAEGQEFPNIGLRLIVRKETPHLFVFSGSLENLELVVDDAALHNLTHPDTAALKQLLNFVLVDIIHRIMVQGKELRPLKNGGARGDSPKSVPVRPHFMKLQSGHKPSDRAKRLQSEQMGWTSLPEGKTFVSAHYRGNRLEYDLPTEPVAVYTDDDLFEAGGLT